MTEATSVIIGALLGAAAGIGGGGFAALASLRASQLAARAPLGSVLHEISDAFIAMTAMKGREGYWERRREFERTWNEFAVQQRILCPSERIANLMELVREIAKNESDPSDALSNLAGQTMEKITRMVGAHSNSFFRFGADLEEARIIRSWLKSAQAKLLSDEVRARLTVYGGHPMNRKRGIRRLAVALGLIFALPTIAWLLFLGSSDLQKGPDTWLGGLEWASGLGAIAFIIPWSLVRLTGWVIEGFSGGQPN
jgi:hypothetical protein